MQPPSSTGQPALSILVILPPSAHTDQNDSTQLAPARRHAPPPLIGRKSGSTVPVLNPLAEASTNPGPQARSRLRYHSSHVTRHVQVQDNESGSEDNGVGDGRLSPDLEEDVNSGGDRIRIAGRRASLAPGLGAGTETRSPESRSIPTLGTIEPSPPGTPGSRSVSPLPRDDPATTHANSASFDAYRVVNGPAPSASSSSSRAPPIAGASAEAPAFGSRSSIAQPVGRRSRRPVTAATSSMQPHRGGSMALPSGSSYGIGGGSFSKTRPGWEADEIVSVLRSGGLEVTLVRNASHLQPLLSSPDGSSPSSSLSQSISVRPASSTATATAVIPVILVPLCDSPSLPSLSLLLAQGTTPTAVCFQQDLLERAKQTEEEWLPSALAQIRTVAEMRNQASLTRQQQQQQQQQQPTSLAYEQPIILAYSANPGLSPQTTQQCIKAGASGVVKPPFHSDTARMVKRMVRAARDGRISSVVDLPPPNEQKGGRQREHDSSSSILLSRGNRDGNDQSGAGSSTTKVVLPPTALDMGGEHEGEKVLEAAMTHRRQQSLSRNRQQSPSVTLTSPTHLAIPSSNGRPTTPMTPGLPIPIQNRDIRTPITARTEYGQSQSQSPTGNPKPSGSGSGLRQEVRASNHDMLHPYLATLSRYCPSFTPRRRSVDVGCLSIALDRATSAFESNPPLSTGTAGAASSTTTNTSTTKQSATPMTRSKTSNQASGSASTSKTQSKSGAKNGAGKKRRQTDMHSHQPSGGHDEKEHEGAETHLAELLSAMYCHTTMVTDVQMGDYAAVSAPLTPKHRKRLVESLATWNFTPHRLDNGDLYRVATLLFEGVLASEGIAELGIQPDQMNRFLFAIRAIYHAPNPYHNYVHAIDVLQATYSFLLDLGLVPPYSYLLDRDHSQSRAGSGPWKRSDKVTNPVLGVGSQRAREVMRPQDVLAVLIAAMGHDVGHPGLSNAFMKNAKVPLSEVYDDKSVLENMHCMLVVRLLRKHGFGSLVSSLSIPNTPSASTLNTASPWALGPGANFDTHGFRKVLYSSVLATDMSLHFAWIARLKSFGAGLQFDSESAPQSPEKRRGKEEEDRIMISQAIIKCADISNPTRPIDVSEHWSSVLLEEWAKQASLEQELDLPVSVIASADAALQAKGQIGFIDLFTQPLFEAVSDILPEFQGYANLCAENRGIWQNRLESFTSDPNQQSSMVQPPIEAASTDDRFRSLFPLLLPPSLFELDLDTDTGPETQTEVGTISSVQSPLTPPQPMLSSETLHFPIYNQQDDSSSSTKAMRAVYYTDLLEHKARGVMNNGSGVVPIPGVGGFEWDFDRRMSTPSGILEGKQ